MVKMNGTDLLTAYRSNRSEGAFTELVRRYTNLVYSVAQRRLANGPLAEEVTQSVFLHLAQAAPKVSSEAALVAWLHRTTVHVAIDVWRSETRRRTREQTVAAMETTPFEDARLWSEMAPKLDEALDALSEEDREAVLLRYFGQKRMREVGQALGVSEDAAKMRVSRAVDRLRGLLALRGVTCTAVALAGLMSERSIEAAPTHLLPRLVALKSTASTSGTGTAMLVSNAKLAVGLAALLGVGLGLVAVLRSPKAAEGHPASDSSTEAPAAAPASTPGQAFPRRTAATGTAADPSGVDNVRLYLHVVDSERGGGLAGARVSAAYFYAGGVPERHRLQTDEHGTVAVPEPEQAGARGMNIFVSAEGHVPKCLSWHEASRTNYTMRLDPALTVGGRVVDEQGQPVGGVNITIQTPGIDTKQRENVAFNGGNCEVTSDVNGRWVCPYVPRDYESVRLVLTCEGYTVTDTPVPVGKPESMNATLVIKRGFTVTGRVLDSEGRPVADATVRELHNWGRRKQSTQTAEDGTYTLPGVLVSVPDESKMNLIVQAKGFAPQIKTVQCAEPTNIAHFALAKASVFRGRVVDEAGSPIPNATVRTDCGSDGLDKYEWLTQADADGRFEWDSAPPERVLFWFEASGFTVIRDLALVPDGSEHEIKLARKPAF
jgi:RNA polymerase sigma factor (sigma-70 family)